MSWPVWTKACRKRKSWECLASGAPRCGVRGRRICRADWILRWSTLRDHAGHPGTTRMPKPMAEHSPTKQDYAYVLNGTTHPPLTTRLLRSKQLNHTPRGVVAEEAPMVACRLVRERRAARKERQLIRRQCGLCVARMSAERLS